MTSKLESEAEAILANFIRTILDYPGISMMLPTMNLKS